MKFWNKKTQDMTIGDAIGFITIGTAVAGVASLALYGVIYCAYDKVYDKIIEMKSKKTEREEHYLSD